MKYLQGLAKTCHRSVRDDRALLSFEFVVIFMALGAMFPFFNLYLKDQLHWTGTQIGLVTSMGSVVVLVTQPFWGRLADATHKGRVLALALASSAVIAMLFPLVSGFALFTALRMAHAVAFGPVISLYDGIVLDKLNDDSEAYGKYRLWGSLGFALAAMIMGRVYEQISFTWMFAVFSLLSVLGCVTALRIHIPLGSIHGNQEPVRVRQVLTNPSLLLLLAGVFITMTANMAGENFLALYIDAMGAPASLTGYAWTLTALVEIPMFLLAPWFINWLGRKNVLVLSTTLFGLKLLLNGLLIHRGVVLFLQVVHGAAFALFQTSAVLMVDALIPKQLRATGQAVLGTVAWSLTGIVGSAVFGGLIDALGIFRSFQLGGYLGVVGSLFILLLVPSGGKESREG